MAKPRSFAAKLAALHALRGRPASPELCEELRRALRDPSNLLVAEAAEIAGKARLTEVAPDLAQAFERSLDNPVKTDKLCRAKNAIVLALNTLEFTDEAFYLRGIRYVQLEPGWGKPTDVGVPVRVASAFALVRLRSRGALALLVDLLADEDKAARVGAVQALTYAGSEAAHLLLRLKVRLGDEEPEVICECFTGLLEMAPEPAVPFVAEFLDAADAALQEGAALALGSSRRPEAFLVLKAVWNRPLRPSPDVLCVALALLRLPAATDFLLSVVAEEPQATAAAAVAALAVHRYDQRIRQRAAAAVAASGHAALRAVFDKRFGPGESKGLD
jgi:HEAT repeat protein